MGEFAFDTQLGDFCFKATENFNDLKTSMDEMNADYEATAKLYAVLPKKVSAQEFFNIVDSFAEQFSSTRIKLAAKKKRMEKAARKEAAKRAKAEGKARRGAQRRKTLAKRRASVMPLKKMVRSEADAPPP